MAPSWKKYFVAKVEPGKAYDLKELLQGIQDGTSRPSSIDLSHQYFGQNCDHMVNIMAGCQSVTLLDLSSNCLGDHGALCVSRILDRNENLKVVRLADNNIHQWGGLMLAAPLTKIPSMAIIDFSNNFFDEVAGCRLFSCMKEHPTLSEIYLSYNEMGPQSAAALAELLACEQPPLRVVDLSYNRLMESGARALAQGLLGTEQGNSTLTVLNLSNNHFQDGGAEHLAEILLGCQALQVLSIAENNIHERGGAWIGAALEQNNTLLELDISRNTLWGDGLVLSNSIAVNQGLTNLQMSQVGIYRNRVEPLCEMVERNRFLKQLDVSKNSVSAAGSHMLAAGLQENGSLTELNLSFNNIGDEGAGALAKALTKKTALTSLTLSDNRIQEAGALQLCAALEAGAPLASLDISQNKIPVAVVDKIESLLAKDFALTAEDTNPAQQALPAGGPVPNLECKETAKKENTGLAKASAIDFGDGHSKVGTQNYVSSWSVSPC